MKPIKLTEQQAEKIQQDLMKWLTEEKMYNGKLDLKYEFPSQEADVLLGFSCIAFAKMMAIIQTSDGEVAWHGVASRTEAGFFIDDVIVYPQTVTGTTVNTDQEEYEKWLMGLDDDVFNRLRMQGHSHVNMGTNPSTVDTNHQERIIEQLDEDDYYIFMIWNKKMDHTIRIFDMSANAMYEDEDIHIYIDEAMLDINQFVTEAKKLISKKTYVTVVNTDTKSKTSKQKDKSPDISKYGGYDDDELSWYGRGYGMY